jgi:hypothetical protein
VAIPEKSSASITAKASVANANSTPDTIAMMALTSCE